MSIAKCFTLVVLAIAVPAAAHADCLWAGQSYPDGDNVFANGLKFVCHSDSGSTSWLESGPSHFDQDVPGDYNPATSSALDYSEGAMLLGDDDHLYQVSDYGGGNVWNDAGSIDDWRGDGDGGGGGGGPGTIED